MQKPDLRVLRRDVTAEVCKALGIPPEGEIVEIRIGDFTAPAPGEGLVVMYPVGIDDVDGTKEVRKAARKIRLKPEVFDRRLVEGGEKIPCSTGEWRDMLEEHGSPEAARAAWLRDERECLKQSIP